MDVPTAAGPHAHAKDGDEVAAPQGSRLGWLMSPRGLFSVFLSLGIGTLVGVVLFTMVYANGASYLSSDPKACVNCHVMNTEYNAWVKSSHGKVATCNDCHTPHDLVGKYLTKAEHGWNHSLAFTTGNFPQNIQIKERSMATVEENCLRCHQQLVEGIQHSRPTNQKVSCVQCHADVGHMR